MEWEVSGPVYLCPSPYIDTSTVHVRRQNTRGYFVHTFVHPGFHMLARPTRPPLFSPSTRSRDPRSKIQPVYYILIARGNHPPGVRSLHSDLD